MSEQKLQHLFLSAQMFAPLHFTIYMHGWMTGNLQRQRKEKCGRKVTLTVLRHLWILKKKQKQTNLLKSHLEAHGGELEAMTLRKLGSSKL